MENKILTQHYFSCTSEYKNIPNEKLQLWREKMRNQLRKRNEYISLKENKDIKAEMDEAIKALEDRGVKFNTVEGDIQGLGDAVEDVLKSLGITEERFKYWFNLRECNCNERKKWLNNLFSWKQRKGDK